MITRSAPSSAASKPASSSTSSMPGRLVAPSTARAAKPTPPAAPAPGACDQSVPAAAATTAAQRRSPAASIATSAGEAPFCGPYTSAAPSGPVSGLSTSAARISSAERSAGCSAGQVERRDVAQRPLRPAADRLAAGVEHPRAERLQQPGAAVGAGAAADAEDDPARARLQRGPQHLSRAEAGRGERRGPPAGQPGQAADAGQLDDRDLAAPRVAGPHRVAGRARPPSPAPARSRPRRPRPPSPRRRRPPGS